MAAGDITRTVDRQGWKIEEITKSLERTDANVENVRRDVKSVTEEQKRDHEAFIKYVAIAEGAAVAAKQAADNSATAKQIYIAFAAAVIALAGVILVGISALGH